MDSNQFESLLKEISEVKEVVIKNTVILDEHARRSTASEKRLEIVETKLVSLDVDNKARERALTWALGILGALGTIFGIVDVIHNFFVP